jgi:methylmalonyl-CoA mutase cobalamin-binding subunit
MIHTEHNPGKYDTLCTEVREKAHAVGAVVIILGGNRGHGFSVQVPPDALFSLPDMLETMAREIRKDLKGRTS